MDITYAMSDSSIWSVEAEFQATLYWATILVCAPKTSFDIRGETEYSMTAVDGNTNDTGTIIFSGAPDKGAYIQTKIYRIEYEGECAVSGTTRKLTGMKSEQAHRRVQTQ